jgi:hypothetical protein
MKAVDRRALRKSRFTNPIMAKMPVPHENDEA